MASRQVITRLFGPEDIWATFNSAVFIQLRLMENLVTQVAYKQVNSPPNMQATLLGLVEVL